MAVEPVTPKAGIVDFVAVGGTSVIVIPGAPNGGFIQNPYLPADQGIVNSEPLYVDPVDDATTNGNGTTFAIQPGGTWDIIPGQTTPTTVNAPTSGHKFSVVYY